MLTKHQKRLRANKLSKKFFDEQVKKGLKRIHIWIPSQHDEKFTKLAKKLRDSHEAGQE